MTSLEDMQSQLWCLGGFCGVPTQPQNLLDPDSFQSPLVLEEAELLQSTSELRLAKITIALTN